MAKSCLSCNMQFDDTTNFCPRCGKPTTVVSGSYPARNAGHPRGCLYCGIQFDHTVDFCTRCGRPTEVGFGFVPIQDPEFNAYKQFVRELHETDALIREQGFYFQCDRHDIRYAHPGRCKRKMWFYFCQKCGYSMTFEHEGVPHCHQCRTAWNSRETDCGRVLIKRDGTL
jgi:predicted amidophosphoribosyltransferase